jgi:hypothetical protein
VTQVLCNNAKPKAKNFWHLSTTRGITSPTKKPPQITNSQTTSMTGRRKSTRVAKKRAAPTESDLYMVRKKEFWRNTTQHFSEHHPTLTPRPTTQHNRVGFVSTITPLFNERKRAAQF